MISGALLMASGSAYAQAPANDNCEDAVVIPGSAPNPPFTAATVDTTTATLDPVTVPPLTCNIPQFGLGDGKTVWYEWTPAASGEVNISTFISSIPDETDELDTAHGLYTGSCDALVEYDCVDIGFNDELITNVDAGVTYRIKVGEFAGGFGQPSTSGGNVSLTIKPVPVFPEQLVIESIRHNVSAPMSSLFVASAGASAMSAADAAALAERVQEIPNLTRQEALGISDPSDAASPGSLVAGQKGAYRGSPKLLQSFEGADNTDNAFTLQVLIAPPDTIGDVGKNHYVQMVNLLTEIFDKNGNSVLGPFGSNAFFTGLGGQCEFTNSGDPIVLYDDETDRWLVSQFASGFPKDGLCIAVSTSGDPTGSYYQYEFDFIGIGFPDYPKYGFATDSINVMANMFSPFAGAGLGVIDKTEAMQPGPATMVFFRLGPTEFGFIPGDNDGPVFDNMPPTFFTNNFFSGNAIDVWEITPDYANPQNTTIAEVASISVSPFDTDLCNASRETCIAQPGSNRDIDPDTGLPVGFPNNIPFLEAISDRMMHRAQTRDFGKRKEAVMSHTVDADGTGKAGVRWYELRNHKDRGWELKKENTFSPDSDNRWMGSIAMTASGETCLGYSISSQTTYPSIGVAGRKGTANHINVRELVAFDGNVAGNVQRQTARWGDYSSMNIDPVDDSCWYTTEYAKPNPFIGERFGWGTRVIQYKLPGK